MALKYFSFEYDLGMFDLPNYELCELFEILCLLIISHKFGFRA